MPNGLVDMDSQKPSACYPRRTFYSLSDSLSTQNYRITMADLNLCLICQSYSQIYICHYAYGILKNTKIYLMHTSVTLWEVTAPVKLSRISCPKKLSVFKSLGWYFTVVLTSTYTTQYNQKHNLKL